jgi:hypothetical protein
MNSESLLRSWHGWVVFLDVYAFSLVRAELGNTAIAIKLSAAWDKIQKDLEEESLVSLLLHLQDSLFLVFSDDTNDEDERFALVQDWIAIVQRILAISAQHDLLLRGGAAYGTFESNGFAVIGEPVERAVAYEKLVLAPVVLLPANECKLETGHLEAPLPSHAPRFRVNRTRDGGELTSFLIIPRPYDGFRTTIRTRLRQARFVGHTASVALWGEAARLVEEEAVRDAQDGGVEDGDH